MYHISDEVRSQRSANRICEAVMDCAKQKKLIDITVSELCRHYGISRTTFYRLFDNISDVLEYRCELIAQEIFLNIHSDSPKEMLLSMIQTLMKQKELIEILSRNGRSGLIKTMQEKYWSQSQLEAMLNDTEHPSYFHSILAQLIPAMLDTWVKGGQQESPEEIYGILQETLNRMVRLFAQ